MIYEDTRQKIGKHNNIFRYFKKNNIEFVRKTLDVGDYMYEDGKIAVDTKQNVLELSNDLYSDYLDRDSKYSKCYKQGIKLAVLVETDIKSLSELLSWTDIHTAISGKFLLNLMYRLRVSYAIDFYLCKKQDAGKAVITLLNGQNGTENGNSVLVRVFN